MILDFDAIFNLSHIEVCVCMCIIITIIIIHSMKIGDSWCVNILKHGDAGKCFKRPENEILQLLHKNTLNSISKTNKPKTCFRNLWPSITTMMLSRTKNAHSSVMISEYFANLHSSENSIWFSQKVMPTEKVILKPGQKQPSCWWQAYGGELWFFQIERGNIEFHAENVIYCQACL